MSEHALTHIEISSRDREESSRFYAELFGWKRIYHEAMDYMMFEPEEGHGGAFSPISVATVSLHRVIGVQYE